MLEEFLIKKTFELTLKIFNCLLNELKLIKYLRLKSFNKILKY